MRGKSFAFVGSIFLLLLNYYGESNLLTSCKGSKPSSSSICKELCTGSKNVTCMESGACICQREPTPTSIGGVFVHCTNWNYVDQTQCRTWCKDSGELDTRVCWTATAQYYCTCFTPPSPTVAPKTTITPIPNNRLPSRRANE